MRLQVIVCVREEEGERVLDVVVATFFFWITPLQAGKGGSGSGYATEIRAYHSFTAPTCAGPN